MRRLFFILMLIVSANLAKAQDLIITNTNDSLNCRITKVTNDHIYFSYMNNGELRKTLISKSDVKQFTKSNTGDTGNLSIGNNLQPGYSKFRLAFEGGFSTRLGKVAKGSMEQYLKDLKKGYNIGLDASYFISESVGFGVKFSTFGSDNKLENLALDIDRDGLVDTRSTSDDITITFVGPGYSARFISARGNTFITSLSIGYLGYVDHYTLNDLPYDLKGGAFGLALDIGYDIKLSQHWSLGAQCSLIRGTLTSYTLEDGNYSQKIDLDEDNYESLSRFDFSVGIRYNL